MDKNIVIAGILVVIALVTTFGVVVPSWISTCFMIVAFPFLAVGVSKSMSN